MRKRARKHEASSSAASSSAPSFESAGQTHLQSLRRASILRSSSRFAASVAPIVVSRSAVRQPGSLDDAPDTILSPNYMDLGTCSEVCEFCGALFWFAERVTSFPSSHRPRYHKCCKAGRVILDYPVQPPSLLQALFSDPQFMSNIRAYNAMFSMTSFGATIDDSINRGTGSYVFKVSGQVCHWVGSLCPFPGDRPRFLQLYIFDGENEVANRLRFFSPEGSTTLSSDVVTALTEMLDEVNEYVRLFRSARALCQTSSIPDFSIKLYNRMTDRRYDSPSTSTLGAIVCDSSVGSEDFDIIIRSNDDVPHRISKLHPAYMPLQYPLLFPHAERGWSPDLRISSDDQSDGRNLTPSMFYCYQIHDREDMYTHLLRAGRLYQQYLVDSYICVEHCRLEYIRNNQDEFRCEFLEGIHDAISRGDTEGHSVGKRVVLPSSFTGGPRYMYKHYQDALALCRVYGNPQYFITFTCNIKWPEIVRELVANGVSNAQDRPDIIARVFQMKVRSFLKFLNTNKPFGKVTAELYTIEFQKRGLPHCHTLLWVSDSDRIRTPDDIDHYISAEIPDATTDPTLHRIVSDFMLHGPCGLARSNSPCMKDGACSKKYPKSYEPQTRFDDAGYVHYKRCNDSRTFIKRGIPLDNGFVVPYNPTLLLHFDAHINVEYCGWSMLIKYLFKYISKGADRVRFTIVKERTDSTDTADDTPEVVDEIKNYVDGRFVCPHEAAWRILAFPIHHRNPPVQVLAVHLEGMQNLTFKQTQRLLDIVTNVNTGKTTLTEWLANNLLESTSHEAASNTGLDLRYVDYLSRYRWDLSSKSWVRRRSNRAPAIGRLTYVHPTCGELFYLRMLLTCQTGCCSFSDIRTVEGQVLPTFREACQWLGLIGDDREWISTMTEASMWATAAELRLLFVHMLLYCDVSDPVALWNDFWEKMGEDLTYNIAQLVHRPHHVVNNDDLQQLVLYEIQLLLSSNTSPRSLSEFGLPTPASHILSALQNVLLLEEKSYDRQTLHREHMSMKANLQQQQRAIYDHVLSCVHVSTQALLFVYGHGGSGKTYLWKTIIAALRSTGAIVLAVAASGIASLLLPSGRTAHSRFKIPLELTDESVCHVKKNTNLSRLLLETKLIIWDEAPMSDRRCFESLDKTLKDVTGNMNLPFGGKSVLLGGDFRQTLPVRPKSTKSDIINSCIPTSYLWKYFDVHVLSTNLRVSTSCSGNSSAQETQSFCDWLLRIGDGEEGVHTVPGQTDSRLIEIPSHMVIAHSDSALYDLVRFVYDDPCIYNPTANTIAERAIICPKNETVDEINDIVLGLSPGEYVSYLSTDSMVPHSRNAGDIDAMYPTEYLNELNFSGIPRHCLKLKKKTPIMLIRNIDQKNGLCNGTRLLVSQLLPCLIEAHIITGTSVGHRVYIPRISFVHNTKELPFVFTRKQFPVKTCYAMTINKSQGQSLNKIGIYLPEPVFCHGQLYVALSRATNSNSVKILTGSNTDSPCNKTINIVYTELLGQVKKKQVS